MAISQVEFAPPELSSAAQTLALRDPPISVRLQLHSCKEARAVNIALKLNVLATCIAFAFIGAILIRAF